VRTIWHIRERGNPLPASPRGRSASCKMNFEQVLDGVTSISRGRSTSCKMNFEQVLDGVTSISRGRSTSCKMSFEYKYNFASPDRYLLLKEFAKKNKQYSTDAERLIWQYIRGNGLGVKFNRQYIISDYIVDFVCLERKLIVEIDGGYHSEYEQIQKDEHRTEHLNKLGFKVVRYTNEEVFEDIERVLLNIKEELLKIV
jgi:very-short-patch-repair endonuclease